MKRRACSEGSRRPLYPLQRSPTPPRARHSRLRSLSLPLPTRKSAATKAPQKPKTHLNQELIPPAVQRLKALCRVDIVNENATIGTTVEGDSEGLEPFLAGGVPEL